MRDDALLREVLVLIVQATKDLQAIHVGVPNSLTRATPLILQRKLRQRRFFPRFIPHGSARCRAP
jgi:hypothetical protein